MRSESFLYPKNNYVSDEKRTIMQGRINPDTKSQGLKYWGSYRQGLKKTMSVNTASCEPRNTFLIVAVQNTYEFVDVLLDLQSVTLKYQT